MTAPLLETPRLTLRELTREDAPFILGLVNEPSWLRYIGDKGVRTLDDARAYLENGPIASVRRHGFALYWTGLKSGEPIGICGLVKRDALEHADLGFAFLPAHWGHGYAAEAAAAVLDFARDRLGLARVLAITTPDNARSARLLEKVGLRFERPIQLAPGAEPLRLFARDLGPARGA